MPIMESRELYGIARLTIDLGYEDFGVFLLEHLLKQLPNHLAARCLLGERFITLERWTEAGEHFEAVLGVEPTNLYALRGKGHVALEMGSEEEAREHLRMAWELHPWDIETRQLLKETEDPFSPLSLGRILTETSNHEEALPYYEVAFAQAEGQPSRRPLAALLLAQGLWMTGHTERARPLLETLVNEQPSWARPKLILADIALSGREDTLGVALLHDASALDSSLEILKELFGKEERYESLVSNSLEVETPSSDSMDNAPAVVSYLLDLYASPEALVLQEGVCEESSFICVPDTDTVFHQGKGAAGTKDTLKEHAHLVVADEQVGEDELMSAADQAAPVRLILSSRSRLLARYGDRGYRELEARLSELGEAVEDSTGHEVIKIYVDDDECLGAHHLSGVDPSDPQQIGRLIQQLGDELGKVGKSVRSLLIVGGDSVIPFHRVANTADDDDKEILTDWPYAARDRDSLRAQFSVGRIPDDHSEDVRILPRLVEMAIGHHRARCEDSMRASSPTWIGRIAGLLGSSQKALASVGYSAQVWAEAARSVFEVIGEAGSLELSPPLTDYDFLSSHEKIPALGYFNLHGFRGRPYWYGHGESQDGSSLLPVALTPLSISWINAEEALIYSEACYGADIQDQSTDESIALTFLSTGALGFVGSTSMSYGALEPPLSGADLLGRHLWEGIVAGLPLGCALRRSREAFIRETAEKQGYLDGEDVKTLMSFVLYGDPALSLRTAAAPPRLDSELEVSSLPLICHSKTLDSQSLPVSTDLQEKIQRRLPFLSMTGFKAHPLIPCDGTCSGEGCATHPQSPITKMVSSLPECIVTSQQQAVSKGGNHLHHVIKVTVSAKGDVTKVLMSRGGTWVGKGHSRR